MARDPLPELAAPQEEMYQSSAASSDAVILTDTEMQRARSQSSTPSISSSSYTNHRAPVKPFGSSSTGFASSGASARLPSAFGTASPFAQQHKEEQEREATERAQRKALCAGDEELAKAYAGSIAERKPRRTSKPLIADLAELDDEPVQRPAPSRRRSSTACRSAPSASPKPVPFHIRVPTLYSPAPTGLLSRSPSVNPPPVPVASPSSPQAGPGPKTQAKRKPDFAVEITVSKKQKKLGTHENKLEAAPSETTPPPATEKTLVNETTPAIGTNLREDPASAMETILMDETEARPNEQAHREAEETLQEAVSEPGPTLSKRVQSSATTARIQDRSCQSLAKVNLSFPVCVQCATDNAYACSFRGRRFTPTPPRDNAGKLKDALFLPPVRADDAPILPTEYSSPFTEHHASIIKTTVAHVLTESITIEEDHARRAGCVKQRLILKDHNTCDGCLTTIFIGSWLCRYCGREICLECATALERYHQAPSPKGEMEQRSRLMRCSKAREVHGGVDLEQTGDHVPMTRVSKDELESLRRAMEAWKVDHPTQDPPALSQEVLDYLYASDPNTYSSPAEACRPYLRLPVGVLDRADPPTASTTPHPAPQPPTSTADSVLVKLDSIDPSTLFHSLWSRGETMVVDLDLSRHFSEEWSPKRFIKSYGRRSCTIASNSGGADEPSTIGEFFKRFEQFDSGEDGESLKLKDFPPTKDFKKELPDLFHEFMNALPAGIVTRRDGPLNIAAHSPINSNVPDLGPKGYWSQISNDAPGGQGSTKLHTCNILLWSNPMPDGSPGLAAWDIYRAEDSEKIRDFLNELKTKQLRAQTGQNDISVDNIRSVHDDPIHSQEFFLDSNLRAELLKEKGVQSWRIWQRPGQVVFIPAGCAHQVCNFSHCIKIAVDFVSRENVSRCWTVTDEFREQTKGRDLWREDVLQLKNQLLWAWRSCERFDLGKGEETSTKADGMVQKGHDEVREMEEDGL